VVLAQLHKRVLAGLVDNITCSVLVKTPQF